MHYIAELGLQNQVREFRTLFSDEDFIRSLTFSISAVVIARSE